MRRVPQVARSDGEPHRVSFGHPGRLPGDAGMQCRIFVGKEANEAAEPLETGQLHDGRPIWALLEIATLPPIFHQDWNTAIHPLAACQGALPCARVPPFGEEWNFSLGQYRRSSLAS